VRVRAPSGIRKQARVRGAFVVALCSVACVISGPAGLTFADEPSNRVRVEDEKTAAPGRVRPAPSNEGLESITVTARKRPESVDRVPVSISVLTDQDLAERTVRRTADLDAPNLEIANTIGFANSARVALRGVGQFDVAPTTDPGVGIYFDGVYLARAQSGLLALADLQRVEVVRGPQGTVFGKNTIGGAINLITAKPEFDFGGRAVLRYGDFDEIETRLALNVPLVSERAAVRLSLATATHDGYQKNVGGGGDGDDEKLLSGRIQLRLVPRANVEVLVAADLAIEDKEPQPATCIPVTGIGAPSTLLGTIDFFNSLFVPGGSLNAPRFAAQCAQRARHEERRRFRSDIPFTKDDQTSFGGSVTILWDLDDRSTLTSISSSRGFRTRAGVDLDGTEFPLTVATSPDSLEQDQMSQEFQFASSTLSGRLRYLLGLYGFREKVANSSLGPDGPGVSIATLSDPSSIQGFELRPFALVRNKFRTGSLSYAAFGQVTFDVSPTLEATVGLRFSHERKRFFRRGVVTRSGVSLSLFDPVAAASLDGLAAELVPAPVGTLIASVDRAKRFSDFTPSASLTYSLSDDLLAYLSFSTGFKSGGFDGREVNDAPEVDPEHLTTYEIGFKGDALDGRLRFSAAAFYSVYRDVQLTVTTGNVANPTDVLNAGRAIIRGGEVELAVLPLENLRLVGALGVLSTKYDRFSDRIVDTSGPAPVVIPVDRDNLDLPFSPNYTLSLSALYSVPTEWGTLRMGAEWQHKGAQSLDVLNTEQLRQGKRGELSVRIGVASRDERVEVSLYGRNLLDRDYQVSGFEQTSANGFVGRFQGPPRSYGVELQVRF